ncbi:sensor histidine kinase KdpD [Massilia sp. TS11]|uniref:sensor histidine kinase n=1 Tax=Massilia sp. TS11 TaxID=2908003 RepID=UPI001EDAACB6|nr:HAMP domain-containing sensor histidine kinase [Massilia sp. TS11]MCG2585127.1 HAMP domain-containing histidine kinase [Massilia sp. TS11]
MADAALFRRLAELDGSVAFVLGWPEADWRYLSPHAASLLGSTEAGALAPLLAGLAERVRRYEAGDASRLQLERTLDWARPDGSSQPLRILSALELDAGRVVAVIGLIRDNSAERERLQAQKRFASMLNHEFRTPLATIDGAIQRLEATGQQQDAPTRERYRRIAQAVDRLLAMLEDYLSPDRLAETGHKARTRPLGAAVLLEEAASRARQAGRQVDLLIGSLPAQLRGDPAALRLALKVLIDNALLYAPAPARLSLSGDAGPAGLELLVADNGPGLPAAEVSDIFQKGFRGSNAAGHPGHGLGLYLARSVIEAQGGRLDARAGKDGGLAFRICLPLP